MESKIFGIFKKKSVAKNAVWVLGDTFYVYGG